jgi:hypothetical protein
MAAQGAIAAIRKGCEMLQEGKAEVQRIKKAVNEAKEIVGEVAGIWDTIKALVGSLFGGAKPAKPPAPTATPTVAEKAATAPAKGKPKASDEYDEHIPDELEIVSAVGENIAKFMRLQAQWQAYYEAEQERIFSGAETDETQGEQALKLVLVETQMNALNEELRTMMTFNAPKQLGPLYSRFNEMYKRITKEQAEHRERERIARQQEAWQREQAYLFRVQRAVALVGVVAASLMTWGLMLSLALLVETLTGSLG